MTASYTNNDATIEACSALLRGEVAAVETYNQAIQKFSDSCDDDSLKMIRDDHEENAAALRMILADAGAEPSNSSGLWGDFAQAIEGTAKLFGESPALRILQQGEQFGISQYEEALADPDVSEEAKELIREDMLPLLHDHIIDLEQRRAHAA